MTAPDPAPQTRTDELLAQVRDELRGLRSDLAKRDKDTAPEPPAVELDGR